MIPGHITPDRQRSLAHSLQQRNDIVVFGPYLEDQDEQVNVRADHALLDTGQ